MIPSPRPGDLVDIHTHQPDLQPGLFCVRNLFVQDAGTRPAGGSEALSVGLHPWHLEQVDINKQLGLLEQVADRPEVVAIGEAGIDRAITIPYPKQEDAFMAQLSIAEQVRKPLIIHCVRAFPELLAILKKHPPAVPVLVHGYRGNLDIARRLVDRGVYLSFGHILLHEGSRQARFFHKLPPDRIFLETDDMNVQIGQVYARASLLMGWSLLQWKEQIIRNYHECFPSE